METTTHAPLQRQRGVYCPVCGRATQGVSRGDCTECTGLFELPKGRKLYDPLTGKLWFKSIGNGTLVNVTHTSHRTADRSPARCSREPVRIPWWTILFVIGAFLSGCLRFIFRGK